MRGFQHIILSVGLAVGGFVHSAEGDAEKSPVRFTKSSQNFGIPNLNATDVSLGDLDGDGDVDAFEVNEAGTARVFLNDGTGDFLDSGQRLEVAASRCALGDLDGDGDLDALAGEWLWLNDGRGRFVLHLQRLESATGYGAGVHSQFVDIDFDGDLDLWTGRIWRNDGAPELIPLETALDDAGLVGPIAFGDFDEDGDMDAVVYQGVLKMIGVFGQPEDSYDPFVDWAAGFSWSEGEVRRIVVSDVDGDGHLDVAVARFLSFLAFGSGDGFFRRQPQMFGFDSGDDFAFGDLDGDGRLDIAKVDDYWDLFGGYGGVFLTTGQRPSNGHSAFRWIRGATDIELADLDGDGDLDCWLLGAESSEHVVALNDGLGVFVPSQQLMLPGGLRGIEVGDLDSDGDLDAWLVWGPHRLGTGWYGDTDQVLLNIGGGRFERKPLIEDVLAGHSVALADFDGDFDLDSYVAVEWDDAGWMGGGETRSARDGYWLNSGDASFSAAGEEALSDSLGRAVVAGDFDSDGFADVAVSGTRLTRVLLNDRKGGFLENFTLDDGGDDVELGDLDGDGDLDLLLKGHVWRNDGTGGFDLIETVADGGEDDDLPFRDSPFYIKFDVGDLDGDGDIDVFWSGESQVAVSMNDGRGAFASQKFGNIGEWNYWTDVELGDLDSDGDLDVWLVREFDGSTIYWNDGDAGFTPTVVTSESDTMCSVALGDLDGDGDLDAIVTGSRSVSVWFNGEEPRIDSVESVNGFLRIEYEGALHGADELGLDGFLPIEGASSPYMVPIGNRSRFFKAR